MKNKEKEAQTKEELAEEAQKQGEYLEQLQRLQAEFINFRNRVEKEKKDIHELAREGVLLKFLDVKDNFDRAPKLDEGMELIYKQFLKVFEEEEIKEIVNEVFNPKFHEAIATDSNHEKDKIVDIIQKGYMRGEFVMRPSKVVVGTKGEGKNES